MSLNTKKRFNNNRQRGIVMILVVVVVVMLVLMGLMFLQSARTQRLAIGTPSSGNINAAIASVNEAIKKALQDDLVDKDGNFFNPNQGAQDKDGNYTGFDEPYDYPWTNGGVHDNRKATSKIGNGAYNNIVGGKNDDTWLASTEPKYVDNDTVKWRHITDLTGVYLGWNSQDGDSGKLNIPSDLPVELPVLNTNVDNSDTDLDVPTDTDTQTAQANQLYDVDGDGIPDSRWEWVPMPLINGYVYTMAVRIVDLDSLLNVNTALSSVDSSGKYDSGSNTDNPPYNKAPHFRTPAAWDMGRWIKELYTNPTGDDWKVSLHNFLNYRMPSSIALSSGDTLVTQNHKNTFWDETGRYFNPADATTTPAHGNIFGYQNEIALRRGNGVSKHPNGAAPTTVEDDTQGLGDFLRGGNNKENWTQADLTQYGGPGAPNNDVNKFLTLEPRHQITTQSGTAIYAPWPNAKKGFYKLDLNNDSLNKIANRVYRIAVLGTTNHNADDTKADNKIDLTDYYGNGYSPRNINPSYYTAQFIANLADYRDKTILHVPNSPNDGKNPVETSSSLNKKEEGHNGISKYTYDVATAYGFEYQPMLSEVYIQKRYTGKPRQANPGDDYKVSWTTETSDKTGYAIEIRNPYRRAVDLTSIYLYVNKKNWGSLSDIIDKARDKSQVKDSGGNEPDKNTTYKLASHHSIIFYCDSTGTNHVHANKIGNLSDATEEGLVDKDSNAIRVNLDGVNLPTSADTSVNYNDWPTNPGGNVYVGLRSTIYDLNNNSVITPDPDNPDQTFPYSTIPIKPFPSGAVVETLTGITSQPSNHDKQVDYAQRFSIGASKDVGDNYINFALVTSQVIESKNSSDSADSLKLKYKQSGTPAYPNRDMSIDRLGKVKKDDSHAHSANVDKDTNQIILRNGKIQYAGELANLMIFGPAPPTTTGDMSSARTIARQWGNITNIAKFQLRFDPDTGLTYPAKYVYSDSGQFANFYIPYGEFMLSQFTTLSPLVDGQDNDGDGTTDNSVNNKPLELIIPGKININTVSKSLLEKIFPIADKNLRAKIAQKIIDTRDSPDRKLQNNPGPKGVASLNELMAGNDGLIKLLTTDKSGSGGSDYSGDTQKTKANGNPTEIQLDFQNPQKSNGDMEDSDGVKNDQEEKTMLLKYLKQIASVRSDRFVAYVEVRGYDSSNFSKGPTATARYIAVFGRGFSDDGAARVLYMERTE